MPYPRIYAFADESGAMIDHQIEAMRRNGLQGLEIRNVDGENISAISLDKAREVRRKLDDAGLVTWSIGSPLGKIDIEKDDFQAHLDALRHTLDLAQILGAANIRMFSFFLPADKDPALFRNQVLDRLHAMVEVSAPSGIALCHENEKGIYGDNAARCLEVLTEVPELRGVFDPANFVQCGQDTLEAWELLKHRIFYMHIKDALFRDHSVVPAGYGDGHVKEVLSAFLAQGGRDLTVEPHLAVFDGLKGLERKGDRSIVGGASFTYASNDEAFDAACNALKALLA